MDDIDAFIGDYSESLHLPQASKIDHIADTMGLLLPVIDRLATEKTLLQDPEILAFARYFLADRLDWECNVISPPNDEAIEEVLRMNKEWGLHDKEVGVLFPEEIALIMSGQIRFPPPWSRRRVNESYPPRNYGFAGQTIFVDIPEYAFAGMQVGFISGVWDLLHGGHLAFIYACLNKLTELDINRHGSLLFIAVDDNDLVERRKGNNVPARPIYDFPQRAGALCGIDPIRVRVMSSYEFLISPFNRIVFEPGVYVPFPIGGYFAEAINDATSLNDVNRSKEIWERQDPRSYVEWFERIAPNLHFFGSEEDPLKDQKELAIKMIGGNAVFFPRFTSLSSSLIAQTFGVISNPAQHRNGFASNNYADILKSSGIA